MCYMRCTWQVTGGHTRSPAPQGSNKLGWVVAALVRPPTRPHPPHAPQPYRTLLRPHPSPESPDPNRARLNSTKLHTRRTPHTHVQPLNMYDLPQAHLSQRHRERQAAPTCVYHVCNDQALDIRTCGLSSPVHGRVPVVAPPSAPFSNTSKRVPQVGEQPQLRSHILQHLKTCPTDGRAATTEVPQSAWPPVSALRTRALPSSPPQHPSPSPKHACHT